jgi:hypothetical protein
MAIGAASPFWTLAPYSDPAQLYGGIRKHEAVLNAIQADAFREASQNQQVTQTAQSNFGAQTTNDQTQTVTLSQTATATNFKRANIDSERQMLISNSQYVKETGGIADLTTDLNALELDTFIDDGLDPNLPGLIDLITPANPNFLVPGDIIFISGTEVDGTPVSATFQYGAAYDGTRLGNLVNAISAAFTTATADYPLAGPDAGRVRLQADFGGPQGLSISLSNQPNFDQTNIVTFTQTQDGTPDPGGTPEIWTSTALLKGGIPAVVADDLATLDVVNAADGLQTGNRILISVLDEGAVDQSDIFEYGVDGTTVGQLLTFIQGKFGADFTASLDGAGRIVLTENAGPGYDDPDVSVYMRDPGANIQFPAFSGRPALPLFSYLAGSNAADYLSRAAAKTVQNQGADQSAVGKDKDFTGAGSKAYNQLSQAAQAAQTFDVDIASTVVNTTTGVTEDTLFNKSRFRRIEVKDLGNAAQAIFTGGQRQGYAADPVSQTAVSGARNILTQTATLGQTGDVLTTGTHNLKRWEQFLVPRSTDILAQVENNSSVNSSAAAQEQNLQQNGGAGKANNDSTATAVSTDTVTVTNTVSILI